MLHYRALTGFLSGHPAAAPRAPVNACRLPGQRRLQRPDNAAVTPVQGQCGGAETARAMRQRLQRTGHRAVSEANGICLGIESARAHRVSTDACTAPKAPGGEIRIPLQA